jgi:hypothetical protein
VQEAPVLSARLVESAGLIFELGNEERGKAFAGAESQPASRLSFAKITTCWKRSTSPLGI